SGSPEPPGRVALDSAHVKAHRCPGGAKGGGRTDDRRHEGWPEQQASCACQQHLPGDEAWLIGEHRTSGEKKYILPTCWPRGTCAAWLQRSRSDGFASKPINS